MRIHRVVKARKEQGTCEACHKLIEAGQGYMYIQPRFGGKRKRHSGCPTWRQSEMTSNDKLSALYAAVENGERDVDDWSIADRNDLPAALDDLRGILENAASEIRDVAEMYTESAQNIEEGFGHETFVSQEMQEHADEVEAFADDVEQADLPEPPDREGEDDDEWDDAIDTWADDARSAAQDVLSGSPL